MPGFLAVLRDHYVCFGISPSGDQLVQNCGIEHRMVGGDQHPPIASLRRISALDRLDCMLDAASHVRRINLWLDDVHAGKRQRVDGIGEGRITSSKDDDGFRDARMGQCGQQSFDHGPAGEVHDELRLSHPSAEARGRNDRKKRHGGYSILSLIQIL